MGSKPDCDNCVKAAWTCEWPPPGRAWCCKRCVRSKMKCTIRGAPQSVKQARAATEEDAGPSQWGEEEPPFLESESEEGAKARTETAGSEIPGNTAMELMEALQAQTSAMQGQVHIKEWLCAQMERLLISLNQHWTLQQELLKALHVAAQGFRYGLGSGLETWAGIGDMGRGWRHGPGLETWARIGDMGRDWRHGPGLEAWAGIATGQEEWSEGEEDEGQGWRCRWNDTLS